MTSPLVSIVVPVFNNARFLAETIQTILQQDYKPVEIIMIDDGSTDGSATIIKNHPDIHYVYQDNRGPAAAKNAGVKIAKGEYVAFLDADDLWASDKLSKQVACMEASPQLGYTITFMRMHMMPGLEKPHWLKQELLDRSLTAYLPSSLLMRRDCLQQVGEFDEAFKTSDEVDWFFRAKDKGVPMQILQEVLLYRRIHDHNLSNNLKALHATLLESVRRSISRNQAVK